jgi:hypothetical protein
MKKYKLALILTFTLLINANAQTWQWVKAGSDSCPDQVQTVCTDANGNSYIVGTFGGSFLTGCNSYMLFDSDSVWESGVNQLFLVKYSPSGNVVWVKSIGGNNPNIGNCNNCESAISLFYDSANNAIYLTGKLYGSATFGSTNLFGGGEMFLTRIDLSGNFIWANLYGNYSTRAQVSTDLSGNVFLAGSSNDSIYFDSIGIPAGSFWAKLDANGKAIWAKIIATNAGSGSLFFVGNSIYSFFGTTNDTAWIDTSLFISNTSHNNIFAKFDSLANIQWLTSFYSNTSSNFYAAPAKDAADNFYITGIFYSDIHFGATSLTSPGSSDFYLAKYDVNGNLIWVRQGNATNAAATGSIATTADGNTYIAGGFNGNLTLGTYNISSATSNEIFIARYNNNGDCLGALQLGAAIPPAAIATDNSGNVFVTARFNPPNYTLGGFTLNTFGGVFIAKHDVITGIEGEGRIASNQLIIYANPNDGKCNITIPDVFQREKNLTLSIFDNNGKLIQQIPVQFNENKIKLNLESEAKGVYNVTLSNGTKNYSGKIIFE